MSDYMFEIIAENAADSVDHRIKLSDTNYAMLRRKLINTIMETVNATRLENISHDR